MIAAALETVEERGDNRRQARRRLSLAVNSRLSGGPVQQATIHDISIGGLLLESKVELTKGETITVELPEAQTTTARVMWNSGRFYGCQFDRPIPTSAVSAALLRSPFDRAPQPAEPEMLVDSDELPYSVERGNLATGARIQIVVAVSLVLWAALLAIGLAVV